MSTFLTLLFSLSLLQPLTSSSIPVPPPENTTLRDHKNHSNKFHHLHHVRHGASLDGLPDLKLYLQRLGYFPSHARHFSDVFDSDLASSIRKYQSRFGLQVTGSLDDDTVSLLSSPRCGVPDNSDDHSHGKLYNMHLPRRYAFFSGRPRWPPWKPTITYWLSLEDMSTIASPSPEEIRGAFERAFARWASVIPVNFTETMNPDSADVRVGFFGGDHGDGEPFDGRLGILAHAFAPENGRFHLDAAEIWAVDFGKQRDRDAVDLESVAVHEIGHLLGLGHSSVKEAVMYPSLLPRTKKSELTLDDVAGVQELYGLNPNYDPNALHGVDQGSVDYSGSIRVSFGQWVGFGLVSVVFKFIMVVCLYYSFLTIGDSTLGS